MEFEKSVAGFKAWLEKEINIDGTMMPTWKRISFLVAANGGWRVGGWGFLSYGGGHPRGLDQNDAIDLIRYEAFFNGATMFGNCAPFDDFHPYYMRYVEENDRQTFDVINQRRSVPS